MKFFVFHFIVDVQAIYLQAIYPKESFSVFGMCWKNTYCNKMVCRCHRIFSLSFHLSLVMKKVKRWKCDDKWFTDVSQFHYTPIEIGCKCFPFLSQDPSQNLFHLGLACSLDLTELFKRLWAAFEPTQWNSGASVINELRKIFFSHLSNILTCTFEPLSTAD